MTPAPAPASAWIIAGLTSGVGRRTGDIPSARRVVTNHLGTFAFPEALLPHPTMTRTWPIERLAPPGIMDPTDSRVLLR
jgi:hypothetical protein